MIARITSKYGILILAFLLTALLAKILEQKYWVDSKEAISDRKAIKIAFFVPEETKNDYSDAIDLATNEINNNEGGVLGLPISIKTFIRPYAFLANPVGNLNQILDSAKEMANDPSIASVISLGNADSAEIIAGILSDKHKLLLTAAATDPLLTISGFENIFATQIDDQDTASIIAKDATDKSIKKFLILGDDSIVSRNLVNRFKVELKSNGGEVIFQYTGFSSEDTNEYESFKRVILFILENKIFRVEDIEGILVAAGSAKAYGMAIPYIRSLHLLQTVYSPANAISNENINIFAKNKIDNVIAVTPFDPDANFPAAVKFKEMFQKKYLRLPSQADEQAYTALKLISFAVNKVNSTDSYKLANYLRTMRYKDTFVSPSGNVAFDENGRITDTDIFLMEFANGHFSRTTRHIKPFYWKIQ